MIPNNGDVKYGASIDELSLLDKFKTKASLKLMVTEQDFLMKKNDTRWSLRAENKDSVSFGESDNMYFIVTVEEVSSNTGGRVKNKFFKT
jgi:hypothetical protein